MRFLPVRACLAVAILALAACASSYRLDTVVETHSFLPSLPSGATYRLERLPSQQQESEQPNVEAMADPALFAAGLRRDDAHPRFAVQVAARMDRGIARSMDPWGWWRPPVQTAANTYYHREVQVVIRDLQAQKVVYDSRAISDSFYLNSTEIMTAMFHAALSGFPGGAQGVRQVNVDVAALVPKTAAR